MEYTVTVSWRFKLPLLLVLFAAAPLGATAFWAFDLLQVANEKSTTSGLQALASARAEAIEQFTSDRRSEVERIAQLLATEVAQLELGILQLEALEQSPTEPLPDLKDAEQLPIELEGSGGDERNQGGQGREPSEVASEEPLPKPYLIAPIRNVEDRLKALRQKLGLILWDQQKFEELLIMATDGQVLVSTFSEHEGKTASEIAYFQNGLGVTYTQPVFLSPITDRLTMVISTPIRDENAEVKAVLAARLNLNRFFRLINDNTGLKDTGETVVGKLIGDAIVMMAPTRLDPDAALKRRVSQGSHEGRALQLAAMGETGAGRVIDYRGKCAYAAWEHVAILEWALVVKMNCDEAIAPVVKVRDRAILWTITIAGIALIAAFFVARALVTPLGALKRATDRMSKGDFDVSLDIRSRDEIGALAESFERMVAAIKYFREQSRRTEEDPPSESRLSESRLSESHLSKGTPEENAPDENTPDENAPDENAPDEENSSEGSQRSAPSKVAPDDGTPNV